MSFTKKIKTEILVLISVLFIGISCINNENTQQSYSVTEKLYNDCSIYQMIFKEGDYAFRFALSGKCLQLTKEMYKSGFATFLKKHKNSINLSNKRFIRVEYYDTLDLGKHDIEDLIKIAERNLRMNFKLKETWDEGFVIEVL